MSPKMRERVARQAIHGLKQCSPAARDALREALLNRVTVEGFRPQKNLTAPEAKLVKSAARDSTDNDALMSALLRAWVERQPDLERAASAFLLIRPELSAGELDWEKGFPGTWAQDEMAATCKEFLASFDQFNEDDVCLMLCLRTGRLPVPCESQSMDEDRDQGEPVMDQPENTAPDTAQQPRHFFWDEWLDVLRALGPDAPEWDAAGAFASEVTALAALKLEARQTARKDLAEALARLQCCEDALEFFELGHVRQWQPDLLDLAQCKAALPLVGDLTGQLAAYMERYNQPTNNFKEQREKTSQLEILANGIMETHERVSAFFGEPPAQGGIPDDLIAPEVIPADVLEIAVKAGEPAAETPEVELIVPDETDAIPTDIAQLETNAGDQEGTTAISAPVVDDAAAGSQATVEAAQPEVVLAEEEQPTAPESQQTGALEPSSEITAEPQQEDHPVGGDAPAGEVGEEASAVVEVPEALELELDEPQPQQPETPQQPEVKPEPAIPTEPARDVEEEIVPPPPFQLPIYDLDADFPSEAAAPAVQPPLPPPDPALVQKVESKLPLLISDPGTYPEAYLLLDWLARRCSQPTAAFPPAAWIQVAYEIFGETRDQKPTLDLAPLSSDENISVELEASRWMLLAGASLLHGEYNDSLLQYQNWMEDANLNVFIEFGEALQSYLRENPISLAKAVDKFRQPVTQPSAKDYFDSARVLYQDLTNPTRFGFTKGKNMMQTMREGLEWLGLAMERQKPEDIAEIEDWVKHTNPNRLIDQWDRSSQPTRFPIDGWIHRDLVRELRELREALREWLALLKAPRADGGENTRALKELTLAVYRESARWSGEMGSLYEFYPTLTGFTNLLLERILDHLKPAQALISQEPTA